MDVRQGIYIFVVLIGLIQTLQIWKISLLIARIDKLVSEETCGERRKALDRRVSGLSGTMDGHTHNGGGLVLYHPHRRSDD